MANNTFRVIGLIVTSCFLTACEPTMFGMPASQFQSLPPSQQQQVINGYNQRQLVQTENQPAEDLIGVAGTLVSGLQQNSATKASTTTTTQSFDQPPPMPSMPSVPSMPDFAPGDCTNTGTGISCHHQESSHKVVRTSSIHF